MDGETDSRALPLILHTFQRTVDSNSRSFWIQNLPEDYEGIAIDYFCKFFIRDEPVCKCLGKFCMQSEPLIVGLNIMEFISNLKNVYQIFGVSEYLGAIGLLTIPEYRGYNIGLELLNSRKFLAKALGLKVSVTLFSGPASQRLAEKAGFKDLVSITFDELEKNDPPFIIPGIRAHTKCLRFMYILYE